MELFIQTFFTGTPLYVAAQSLGLFIATFSFFIYFGKKRGQILTAKLISDVLNVIQLTLLAAYTGAVINVIAVFREVVFYNRLRSKWAAHRLWLYVFVILMGLSPVLSWQGYISLLPALGSAIAVVGFYAQSPTHTRIIGLFAQSLWLVYALYILNLGAILQNTIMIVAIVTGLIRDYVAYRRQRKKNA